MTEVFYGPRISKQGKIRLGCTAAVFDGNGRILLTKRSDNGQWCLPGGAVDPGETVSVMRWMESSEISGMGIMRSVPLTNLYESLIFFVWCVILGYLIIEFKYKNRSFVAFVSPVAGLALAFIDITGMSKEIHPLIPITEQLAFSPCDDELYCLCSLFPFL